MQIITVAGDGAGETNVILSNNVTIKAPQNPEVFQNYPNPSNPVSKINFRISLSSRVSIIVYDLTGKQVISLLNTYMESGYHSVEFDGSGLASVIYFYVFSVKNESYAYSDFKKMILIK